MQHTNATSWFIKGRQLPAVPQIGSVVFKEFSLGEYETVGQSREFL